MAVPRIRLRAAAPPTLPQAPSVADLVTGRAARQPPGTRAATWAGRAARRGLAVALTPAGERILRRIGYRRVAAILTAAAAAVALPLGMALTAAVVTAPTAIPAAVAATVLDEVAKVFGDDNDAVADLVAAGADDQVLCTRGPDRPHAPSDESDAADPAAADTAEGPSPIPLSPGGSITESDAHLVVDPVPPGTSALTANVWFLYRLSGQGDWETFTAAYTAAELNGDDTAEDAVLVQTQMLNSTAAEVEDYRLTAAALTLAGMLSGRLSEPHPDFRGVLAVELVSGCVADAEADAARVPLPLPPPSAMPAPESGDVPIPPDPPAAP